MPKGTNKETGSQFDENRASCGFAAGLANLILARNPSLASYRRIFHGYGTRERVFVGTRLVRRLAAARFGAWVAWV
jgi:hypothetical protein